MRLGILYNGIKEEILVRGMIVGFFFYGLGYYVGLEVYDVSGRERLLLDSKSSLGLVGGVKSVRCRLSLSKRELVLLEMLVVMFRDEMKEGGGGDG